MSNLSLGIDMGGTGIKFGLIDRKGKLLQTMRASTPARTDPEQVVSLIAKNVQNLLKLTGRRSTLPIGIGCAGDVDPVQGIIRISPNLRWKQVPLKALLTKRLKCRIRVENDANVAAWAAYVVEAKRKIQNLICVTIGTGIGGGLVIGGKLFRGATGSAGEIGHMTLFPEGVPCNCGNQGCVERYVGARAMASEVRRAIESGEKTVIPGLVHNDFSRITPLIVHQAAQQKDPLALRLWNDAGERLGITLAGVINMLNPQWIVLAGGLSRAGRFLVDPLRRTILQRSFPTPSHSVKLVISRLDQDLGTVGAGLLAHEKFR